MKNWFLILTTFLLIGFLCASADACPTCKLALEEGSDHTQRGYAYSIVFMMSMPFLIALGWTIFIVKSVWKAEPKDQQLVDLDSLRKDRTI